jgi:hypothetical protein
MGRPGLLRWLGSLSPFGLPDLSGDELLAGIGELVPGRGSGRLLLGHYGEKEVREALEQFGVADQVRRRGIQDYVLTIDASDPEHQRLLFYPGTAPGAGCVSGGMDVIPGRGHPGDPMAEMILREAFHRVSIPGQREPRRFHVLVIQWLCLQDPRVSAGPDALLPGQKYPGLGAGKQVMEMLGAMMRRRKLDGILNRPEFVHNAILYSSRFRYVNPVAQGRLLALQGLLGQMSLHELAWAVERGQVVEDGTKAHFRWYQSEQIWPNCDELTQYFEGNHYRTVVEETRQRTSYQLATG